MSVFTLEVAGRAIACISARSRASAEDTINNPWFRDGMLGLDEEGPGLWDGASEWQLREATVSELAIIQDRINASDKLVDDDSVTVLFPAQDSTPADHKFVLASRVENTPVYDRTGELIGHVEDLSINRIDGQVLYAIISFGGFLGIGKKFHPLPWSLLEYDSSHGGYVVQLDKQSLANAPFYEAKELRELGGPSYDDTRQTIYEYYGRYGSVPF